jgi:hypothetical protein
MNSSQLGRKREDSKPIILGGSPSTLFANAAFGGKNFRTAAQEIAFV